jgi:uncharacterized membrane protein YphA (DoxX/SURF4 family)
MARSITAPGSQASFGPQHAMDYLRWAVAPMFGLSLLISHRLWQSTRDYPLTPVCSGLPQPPFPVDYMIFGIMLLALIGTTVLGRRRFFLDIVIGIGITWMLLDQSRWQPWFIFSLMVMFCLRLGSNRIDANQGPPRAWAMTPVQLLICLTYVYSGLQKLHYRYFTYQFAWMTEPLFNWLHLSEAARSGPSIIVLAVLSAVLETTLGLLLPFRKTRRWGVLGLTGMHTYILLMIGPFGRSYNMVVWPWNVAVVAALWCLFWSRAEQFDLVSRLWRRNGDKKNRNRKRIRGSRPVVVTCIAVVVVFGVLPILSFWDRWDAYLSFQLYSGKDRLVLFQYDPAQDAKLPAFMRRAAKRAGEVNLFAWALEELNAVPVQEERVVLNIGRTIATRAPDARILALISSSPGLVSGLRTYSVYAFPAPDYKAIDVTAQSHVQVIESP